jgi:hypothetical protein
LPDLLKELGFHVISRPAIGVTQRGVDVAAVGKDEDGDRKLFLFSAPTDLRIRSARTSRLSTPREIQ